MLRRGDRVVYAKDNKLVRVAVVEHVTAESRNAGQRDYEAVICSDGSVHRREDVILLTGDERYGTPPTMKVNVTMKDGYCTAETAKEIERQIRNQIRTGQSTHAYTYSTPKRPQRRTVRECLDSLRQELGRRGRKS